MFSDAVYEMIEIQFSLMLRGKELGLDNLLNTTVELYKYFHNGNKHNIQQNTANTYGFLKLYCQKKEKKELGEQVDLLVPDFLRLFVNACYQFIKLDYINSEKKKRFCCF
jgi:hypothetical protein